MSFRQIMTSVVSAAVVAGGAVALAPAAEAYTKPCRPGVWCIYKHAGYGIELKSPGTRGKLTWNYDKASSFINNTGKSVCLYDFRPDQSGRANLVMRVKPYQDIRQFTNAQNDRIDAYYSTTASTCAAVTSF